MERNWSWRVALVIAVTLLSVWQLVPTWHYFNLPPEERNGEAYEKSVPRWAPNSKKHLNLGLDLQGGVLLAMGVDVDKAVKAKIARRADEIVTWLGEKKIPFDGCAPTADGSRVECRSADPAVVEKSVIGGYGAEVYAPRGAPAGTVQFAFMDKVVADFRKKAVDQAEKTIRNRIDKWGVTEPDIKRKGENQIQIQLPGFKDPKKAEDLIGRTAQLEFRICDDENAALDALRTALAACPAGRDGLHLPVPDGGCWWVETVELPNGSTRESTIAVAKDREQIDALSAEKVKPLVDPTKNAIGGGKPIVTFSMSVEGARLMEKLTSENIKRRMATVLDDKVETAPYIQSTISAHGQITLGGGKSFQEMNDEANELAIVLKAG